MKVLIISHNPISTFQNMGKTFLSLFDCFKKEELCQLYIYPSIPNVDKCESYFRITDKDVLHNFFKRNFGREILKEEIAHAKSQLFESSKDENIYRNPKNERAVRRLLRDMMWNFSHWYNKNLISWMKKEKPTAIFVAPGTAKFVYNIALKISKKFNLPIVTYICDDYYFVKNKGFLLKRIQVGLLKRKIEQLMKHTKYVITISKELEKFYSEKFCLPSTTFMTGSNYRIAAIPVFKKKVSAITYMGNLSCNRYNSLADIGEALDEINEEGGEVYKLCIYTGEKNNEVLNPLKKHKSIILHSFVVGEEFNRIFHSADMLLHVEAFDEKSVDRVKYSVSTKIADSLGSGICLFAYGPENVSSMKHLIENDCAIFALSKAELKEKLLLAFNDGNLREEKTKRSLIVARKYHDSNKTSNSFHDLMEKTYESAANKQCL